MPIYEFRCGNCGSRMEKMCPIGESGGNLKCPQCEKLGLTRVMSSFFAAGAGGGRSSSSKCGSCSSGNCSSCGHS
ncbi:Zinc ribbon domain protein [Pelotomaculum schinkii]|uniref:Zinc ribbon domain protein n=1 Tax=Pelotomaculum schinkii TaxID=78350 RepID=A0A4Y7RAV2_9FIRM|nr:MULTISPECIES: zinc ribbon domain-containing protein [Pelotomaculum]TEB05810.1 Zinc ribbon domain protein [Pelotomaculum schinkii]TEB17977.1 Zinc ribbon domain protein [Pelotomaculum sp. FP]